MSGRFVLSTPAARDLDEIVTFVLENDGPERARHIAGRLQEALHKVAEFPGLGHKREDLQLHGWPFVKPRVRQVTFRGAVERGLHYCARSSPKTPLSFSSSIAASISVSSYFGLMAVIRSLRSASLIEGSSRIT